MEFWQTYLMVKDKLDMLTLLPDEYYRGLYRNLAIMCEEVNFEYHADMAVNPSWDLENTLQNVLKTDLTKLTEYIKMYQE